MTTPMEQTEKPLGDSEITRLIRAAGSESYQKKVDAPKRDQSPFKPRSLLDIAKAATPTPMLAAPAPTRSDPQVTVIIEEDAAADLPAADLTQAAAANPAPPAQDDPVADADMAPLDDGSLSPADTASAAPVAEPDMAAPEPEEPVIPSIPLSEHQEALEKAETRAFDAGRTAALQEAQEAQANAIALLERAARALLSPDPEATADLNAVLEAAVLTLASERAGLQIDQPPAAFLARIEKMAERIGSTAKRPILRLHPDDATAIEPLLTHSDVLSDIKLMPHEGLTRGDIDLRFDGIRLADCLTLPNLPAEAGNAE